VGGVDAEVLRQRRLLGVGGFVSVFVEVDLRSRRIADGPLVESRGFTTEQDRDQLHGYIADAVRDALDGALRDADADRDVLTRAVRRAAGSTVNQRTRRRPMIVPVVRLTR
jgi:ribonuclease J